MARQAIVIGAGIGGLATAVALIKSGWDVSVWERAEEPQIGGTALGMWPPAMAALDALCVGDRVREVAVLSRGATILRHDGSLIARVPSSQSAHLLSRERLLSELHRELPRGTVQWGRRFTADGPLPQADLVVGADGIHSEVRLHCWGESPLRPLGTVAYRGVVDGPVDTVTETWGDGALFGITPSSDGQTNWFACLRRDPATSDQGDRLAALRTYFAEWRPQIGDVLNRAEPQEVDRRNLFDVTLHHPYVTSQVALIGDAAHAMAPNLGRGACESLIDAVTLAREVTSASSVEDGLRRYDRSRRRKTRRIVRTARMVNRLATAERGGRLRNNLMSLALRR